jgi:hypothetical protein
MRCEAGGDDGAGRSPATSRPPSRRSTSSGSFRCPARRRGATAGLDGGDLALQPGRVEPGAAAAPVGGLAAIERGIDRGGRGGVADAHLAEAEQIRAADQRLHAEGHGGDAGALVERVTLREIPRRQVDGEVEDLEADDRWRRRSG